MEPALRRVCFKAMGSPCELHFYEQPGLDLPTTIEAAQREIVRLERKYSRYRDDSVTTRIDRSAGEPDGLTLDDETAALLDYAAIAFEHSDGLFDITSGILRRAWNFAAGRLPERREVEALLPLVGWQEVVWERPRLRLPRAGMELDFGGFAKEYAADRVAELCRRRGLRHGLVDLGGDLAVVGPHPDGSPWKVGVRDPRRPEVPVASIWLLAGAIATSGDYERFLLVDGRRYGHILDPHTGWPVEGLASVSITAPHCLVAGSAATIAMLKGRDGARWLDDLGLPHLCIDVEGRAAGPLLSPRAGGAQAAFCAAPA